ncbi:hypothetical protein [Enterobacter genomosp. S]|uniref:Uncharacterized protein n=1 Tax=Enterobacter genomosp. S TaxID=2364151 RepID=A0ABR5YPQ3_9ENTR|nr:hypothetical protein [Enterobacter genomosp. S]KZR33156.1 hypothetical protein A3466_09085 [Enterobacter genomosp. S]
MKKIEMCDIFRQIEQDFKDPARYVCRTLFLFLTSENARKVKHFTYKTLINGTGLDVTTPEDYVLIIKATDYFSSYKAHLLNMHFQYIDDTLEEPIAVDDDLISHALDTGKFYHPETGELVDNFNKYLYPYFTPSDFLESLHG